MILIQQHAIFLQAQNDEFQRHLQIHQQFTEGSNNLVTTGNATQDRAKEIKRQTRGQFDGLDKQQIWFQNSKETKQHQRKLEAVQFQEQKVQETEVKNHQLKQVKGQIKKEQSEERTVTRSQTLPRKAKKQDYIDEKQQEFEEFIRNQRNLLLNQLYKREEGQESKEIKGHSSKVKQQSSKVEAREENTTKEVKEDLLVSSKGDSVNSGLRIEDLLTYPAASKNKRRHKSTNDAESIKQAKSLQQTQESKVNREAKSQRSQSSSVRGQKSEKREEGHFLLQNNEEAKVFEKNSETKEDIVRVYSRGGIIQLSMEEVDRERFEQRQREYEELQKRRSLQQQEQRKINDDRYRYLNNEFDKNSNGYYYNEQKYNPGNR